MTGKKIDDLKRFFEGEGYPVNLKYKDPVVRSKNCQVIAISNQPPFDAMSELDRKSFETRMLMAEFTSQMQRHDEKFPFIEIEQAVCMKQRLIEDGDLELMIEDPTIIDETAVDQTDNNSIK